MPVICQHGLEKRFCAVCQPAGETGPLRRDALRVTEEGKPALILGTILGTLKVNILVLDGDTLRFEMVKEISLRHPLTVLSFKPRKVLDQFLHLALRTGYLFQPENELSYGEQIEEGPPRCYFDHSELSLEKGSLGCSRCRAYVCRCGRCLCGYKGKNYPGQEFSFPPLPIPREERLEYIRVVRFCDLNRKPVSSARKVRHLYLIQK